MPGGRCGLWRKTIDNVEHPERGKGDVPQAQQTPRKLRIPAKKILAMKSKADDRATHERRENQPPSGDEIERVRHKKL